MPRPNPQFSEPLSTSTPSFTNSKTPRSTTRRPYRQLTIKQRKAICERHLSNPDERHYIIALDYAVDPSSISAILRNKEKWLRAEGDEGAKRLPRSPYRVIEQELQRWLMQASEDYRISLPDPSVDLMGYREGLAYGPFTNAKLIEKAHSIAASRGINDFRATHRWADSFKEQNRIWEGFLYGDGYHPKQGKYSFAIAGVSGCKQSPEEKSGHLNQSSNSEVHFGFGTLFLLIITAVLAYISFSSIGNFRVSPPGYLRNLFFRESPSHTANCIS